MNILKKVFLGFIFVFGAVNLNASSSSDTDDCVDFKENPYRGRAKIVAKITLLLAEKGFRVYLDKTRRFGNHYEA